MDNRIKNTLGILSSLFLASLLVIALGYANDKFLKPDQSRTISMSAEGKVTAKPDLATLSFSVVTQGKEAEKVQKDNDAKMTAVIEHLKSSGVAEDDIETSGYNLYPQYDYSKPEVYPGTVTGYNLTQNVTAKIRKLETVPTILGSLTAKGVNQINNVAYTIDDPDKLKADARNQAIDKAKDKAKELAKRLGVRLGKVINFSESGGGVLIPIYYDKSYLAEGRGGASPTQPGTEDVTVSVTLTFELK